MERICRLPHTMETKYYACKLAQNNSIQYVCRRYKISARSLYRWLQKFDGTMESLRNKSHKPLSPHPNSHTKEEIKHINDLLRRNPNISLCELYGKLRTEYAYSRHANSLFRFIRKQHLKEHKEYHKPRQMEYDTPKMIGIKWQMDVKYIPSECKSIKISGANNYYQYTCLDEASRKRFIFAYDEHSSYSTVDFIKRAIVFFGYVPKCIQTDNGYEFTYLKDTKREHPIDVLCNKLNINHKLIRPRTPRHNGKVERSHRNDNNRFYKYLRFYSLADLRYQMKLYLIRSNNIPMSVLGWKTPNQIEIELKNSLQSKDG